MFKKLVIPLVFFGLLFASNNWVFAYDSNTTHPALTQEIVDFNGSLTAEQKEWVIQGSIDEDTDPRYANHFYDPIRQIGWTGADAGSGTTLASVISQGLGVDSAVNWINDVNTQASYLGGDRTWKKALDYLVSGNEKEAYITLGHILHVLEDMSVPDHTRDDTHAQGVSALTGDDGSPYEQYTSSYNRGNIKSLGIADELQKQGAQTISEPSIGDYLISLAQYSNKYFFSKDTINSSKYSNPQIVKDENSFGYGLDENKILFPLVISTSKKGDSQLEKVYSLGPKDSIILQSYFTHLARQTILYGSGAISLFQKEAKDAVINKDYPVHAVKYNTSLITGPLDSFFGAIKWSVVQAGQFIGNVFSNSGAFLSGLFNSNNNLKPAGEFTMNDESQAASSSNPIDKKVPATIQNNLNQGIISNTNSGSGSVDQIQPEEVLPAPALKKVVTQPKATQNTKTVSAAKIASTSQVQPLAPASSSNQIIATIPPKQCSFDSTQGATRQGVIINEVAWMGTLKSSNDEWIELKNISGSAINLNGWQILGKGGDIKIVFGKSDGVAANGFYILERTDDTTLPDITANKIYSGALSNSSDGLRFFDSQCNLIDEAVANPSWPAGDDTARKTMERDSFGLGWHTSAEVGGTPGKNNSEPAVSGGGGTSAGDSVAVEATSTPVQQENSGSSSNVNHIIISEIQAGTDTDSNDEFIELYNPTNGAVNVTDWELRKKTSSGAESNLLDNSVFSGSIPAKGFFLIGSHSYSGSVAADIVYSVSSTGIAYSDNSVVLYNGDHLTGSVIDEVSYAGIEKGKSLERNAFSGNGCVSAQNEGEFLGNGCDTDSVGDFEIRASPHPQNSQNLPEPRSAPEAVKNFNVVYSSSSMGLSFNWDAAISTATTTYELSEYSGTNTVILATSTSTVYLERIKEIGRDYLFLARALDIEGMPSLAVSTTISVPSFLGSAYFYRNSPTGTDYYIESYHNGYPFVPDLYGWSKWNIAVFYFNTDAKEDDLLEEGGSPSLQPHDSTGILPVKCLTCGSSEYRNSLIFPEDYASSNGDSAAHRASVDYAKASEDNHLLFQALLPGVPAPSSTDYFTVAYYSTYDVAPLSRGYGFKLVALDKRKIYLSDNAPAHNSPILGGDVSTIFNEDTSQVSLSWPTSTDSDTLDRNLSYQIKYSSSSGWQSVGSNSTNKNVAPGDSLEIQVCAFDDQGNYSDPPLSKNWFYPTTTFYISQASTGGWSGNFGEKDQNSLNGPDSAVIQSVIPDSDFQLDRIVLRVWHSKTSDLTQLRLRVFGDNGAGRPNLVNQIGESSLSLFSDPDPNTDMTFRFNQPISLTASFTYWLVLDVSGYIYAGGWGAGFMNNAWRVAINSGVDAYTPGVAGRITNNAVEPYDNGNYLIPNPDATSDWYMKIGMMEK